MHFIDSILTEYSLLRSDFLGIRFDAFGFFQFIFLILFSLTLFYYFYSIGDKVRRLFFRSTEHWEEKCFISIALGYIVLCSGLATLGIFSLLTSLYFTLYFGVVTLIILIPPKNFYRLVKEVILATKRSKQLFSSNKLLTLLLPLFIVITLLRLIPPEIGADAMEYHTSFPKIYLYYHTIMLPPIGTESYITIPQLGEIPYMVAEFFHALDATRIIHFLFFLLCVLLLLSIGFSQKQNKLFLYAVLIIVTSPLIIHISSSAYSDFQAIFCFLLAVTLLTKEKMLTNRILCLSAVLFGGMLASKLWGLAFLPCLIIYIIIKNVRSGETDQNKFVQPILFTIVSLLPPLIWYIRSFMLSGNPFYHNMIYSPAIVQDNSIQILSQSFDWSHKLKLNMFSDYSILFFLGILGNFLSVQTSFKTIKKISLSLFTLIFTITYIFLPSILFDNRYILSFYVLLSVVAAGGLLTLTSKFKYGYIFLIGVTSFLFLNYLTNTIAILPYGLGWAKTDNYLSRKMTENMEYYDFNHHFSKFMHTNETIATYGLAGYYYASFNPKNIYYFFNGNHNSLNLLLKQKIDKLLIRGGDFNWFCKSLGVTDCGAHAITLLAGYPQGRQYLYQINK